MKAIKNYIFQHFETLFPLFLVTAFSLFLLMIRLKVTHSFFFSFLVWNLFLAFIPFIISFYLRQQQKPSKIKVLIGFCTWLLFLPNAPYLITDLIHLRHSGPVQIWLDMVMISLFAIGGLLCYSISMQQMEVVVAKFIKKQDVVLLFVSIHFLTGFGIYLGRFLRFNSWDIVQNPMFLISEISQIVLFPMQHKIAWTITLFFGLFLWGIFLYLKRRTLRFFN